ncbi:MAG TPA: hypothetical protein EYN73_06820 [Chromatiaceae bacterium]|jgi:hypothetical protein|nr:hypothetical protein [Chromatiaceae bacterium]HIA08763.1 hypothetical protein [Chromatiaceae bacterium]HIN82442.1 hypothetical protein [Chromatiales bacterium]HIO54200.1 hypothetical protein [Chromatiales bacterium]
MDRALSVHRAAHFVGVSTDEIYRLIEVDTLTEIDGKVLVSELRHVYPDTDFTGSKMIDVVEQIKDDVLIKALRIKAGGGKAPIDPVQEIKILYRDLAYYQERADAFRALSYDLRGMVRELEVHIDEPHRIKNILSWLDQKMRKLK